MNTYEIAEGSKIGRGNRKLVEELPQFQFIQHKPHRLCGIVARILYYRSRVLGSIPGASRVSEK
jgi:hypothetical protein